MKCSKCGYLGFEIGARCRNCGYEFSLAQAYDAPDLTIRRDSAESQEPYDVTIDTAAPASSIGSMALDPRPARRPTPALPLFTPPDDDTPLITRPSPPRAPLAVRRSTPETARLRAVAASKAPAADLALDLRPARMSPAATPSPAAPAPKTPASHQDAGIARRVLAGGVDLIILFAIDVVVVYFTMQICGIGFDEMGLLPKGPLGRQMLRRAARVEIQLRLQLPDRVLAVAQQFENAHPRRMAEHPKQVRLHLVQGRRVVRHYF